MVDNISCFRNNSGLFRRHLIDMQKSPEYAGIESQLDSVLLLADRIMAAFLEDLELGQVSKVADFLTAIRRALDSNDDPSTSIEALLQATEQWLKPVLKLVYPDRWERLNANKTRFTLFPTIRELELLSQAELDLPEHEAYRITDEIRLLIYWNRKDRNYVTHATYEAPPDIRRRFLTVALVTLIAPIYKYQEIIRSKLLGFVASPLPSKDIEDLLKLVDGERRRHLDRFRGREKWLADLQQMLDTPSTEAKPYLLLIGYEGIGKSALCARVTDNVSNSRPILGRYAGSVRKVASWLPFAVLHFGKQSNQPYEIVRSLVAQANTLVLEPVPLPNPTDYLPIEAYLELEARHSPASTSWSGRTLGKSSAPREYSSHVQSPNLRRFVAAPDMVLYRRSLYLILEKVSQEHGPVTLILDAIDEISPDGSNLSFLPERLPSGVSALLTARQSTRAVAWLTNNRDVHKIRLTGLERREIALVTNVMGQDKASLDFNERVWRVSQGWPVLVLEAAKKVQASQQDLTTVQIESSVDEVFARQASEWNSTSTVDGLNTLHEVLLLLAIFEPACPIDLDLIQSYLKHRGLEMTLNDLRQAIQPVNTQIEGVEIGKVKLGLKAFAEYVRDRYCSQKDLYQSLERIVDWLIDEPTLEARTVAPYLQYWTDPNQTKSTSHRSTVLKLLDALIERKSPILYDVYLVSHEKQTRHDTLPIFAEKCLRACALARDSRACLALSARLIDGAGLAEDPAEGERWLRQSAESGDVQSMLALANRLLNGNGIALDKAAGEDWLRRAVRSGDSKATVSLAARLLLGNGLEQNTDEGEELLRQQVEAGSHDAAIFLALGLLSGNWLSKDLDEAESILRQLASEGDDRASFYLGGMLLDSSHPHADVDVAKKWLQQSIDAGNKNAVVRLGTYLLDKGLSEAERAEGEMLLRKAVAKGNTQAMLALGQRLIDGRNIVEAAREGEQLLQQAAEAGDHEAMTILGYRLLDGAGLKRNAKSGEGWLRRAADEGNDETMTLLAVCLLDGKGMNRNQKEGELMLRSAARSGSAPAMLELGMRLEHGIGLQRDKSESRFWLNRAAHSGNPWAMGSWGQILLAEGDPNNAAEGERLLRMAAEMGPTGYMIALGTDLIDGTGLQKNVLEGRSWLDRAANAGDSNAMIELGQRLLDGAGLAMDSESGKAWLIEATEKGSTQAMRFLGTRFLKGIGLPKDVVEGEAWLRKAVEKHDLHAMTILSEYLLNSKELRQDHQQGARLLRQAAEEGDVTAMITLSDRLKHGRGIPLNSKEAERWAKKAYGSNNSYTLYGTGREFYRDGNLPAAAESFLQSFQLGNSAAGNALAYMARRSEVPSDLALPTIADLLAQMLDDKESIGIVNHALCFAAGFHFEKNWPNADQLIASITSSKDVIPWWYDELVKKGDPEGHLVVGWLVRHNLIKDPDGMTIAERMALARNGGWNVPEWMDAPAIAIQEPVQ